MVEFEGHAADAARAVSQKAYKKEKKKRAKAKQAAKAEKKNPDTEQGSDKWHRVFYAPGRAKATDRPVEDIKINELLEKRSKAKEEKNYTLSDEITESLIDMEICYDDAKKQWHTRLLATVAQKAKKALAKKRESEKKSASEGPATKKAKK
eukprot:CAMPEP_0198141466 /NCGR_PEP_ID=MMETSP1443-20131203/4473_1 /TAXON_ID=186043 /ORGANISM="Entomoneis sp., Strain CCMP2396" /LENGTH=150 /DNA_ID=CAMNT_0043804229 /DNA_START=89 /DNA_END=541 /DNA_ORIENTATION=+